MSPPSCLSQNDPCHPSHVHACEARTDRALRMGFTSWSWLFKVMKWPRGGTPRQEARSSNLLRSLMRTSSSSKLQVLQILFSNKGVLFALPFALPFSSNHIPQNGGILLGYSYSADKPAYPALHTSIHPGSKSVDTIHVVMFTL